MAIDKEKAFHLLQHTTVPVSEISRRLGYSDSSALRKLITRETRLLPKEYREKCRQRQFKIQRLPPFEADPCELSVGVGETRFPLFHDLPVDQIGQSLTRLSLVVKEGNDEIKILFRGEGEGIIPGTQIQYKIDVKQCQIQFFNPLHKTYIITLRRFFNEFIPGSETVAKRLSSLEVDNIFDYKTHRYQVLDIGEIIVTTRRIYQRGVRSNTSSDQVKDKLLVLKNLNTGKDFVIHLNPTSTKKKDPSSDVVFKTHANVFLIRNNG